MWVPIKKILPFTIDKLGIKSKMDVSKIFQVWDELMDRKYQNFPSQRTTPLSFKKGLLIIGCSNSILAAEFRLREKNILREINKKIKLVQKIKFICQ